jgi:2-keto-4-pentenoate hydratase/2-oxohepta-3-ene-1,7-dioic acid hydratase in catechol pathway
MRVVRFETEGRAAWGIAEGESIAPLEGAPWEPGGARRAGAPVDRRTVRLLAPAAPTKILGIGRNYGAHAKELGNDVPKEPLVFLKAPSSVIAHGGTVRLPKESQRVDYEGELALVIGRRARRVPRESWRDVVFGFTCALDITARDLQKTDGQWWRAKGFDTFCPLGPAIETDVDPADLALETFVDGERRQNARSSDLIFDVGTLIAWTSAAMTLEPGDVILTGTPEGVGPLAAGQTVEVRISGVGTLSAGVEVETGA